MGSKFFKILVIVVLLSVGALLLNSLLKGRGKANVNGNPKIIKMVSSLPRTGASNKQTTDIINGIKLAIEESQGKVGEFEIQYEDWDDASAQKGNWEPALEASNATKAINDPDVMVYLGPFNSGAAKVSIPILNKAHLLMISPANTWPGLTKPGKGAPNEPAVYRPTGKPNYCRVVPADDIQGPVGAEWARRLGAKKIYVLHDRELYGQGIADLFKQHAMKIGLEIVGYEGIDTKAINYDALATKIRGTNPDLVYFGAVTNSNAGQLAKDLRKAQVTCSLMVPDGCYETAFIEAAGKLNLNDKTYATFGGAPADKWTGRAREFLDKFSARFNNPNPEPYSIYGYECAKVALEAIRRAGKKDRVAILEACFAIRDFDGALGKWSFDANGDTSLTVMSGSIVKDGKWEFLEQLKLD